MRRLSSTVSTRVARAVEHLGQLGMLVAQAVGHGIQVDIHGSQVGAHFVVQLARQARLFLFAHADQVARQHR